MASDLSPPLQVLANEVRQPSNGIIGITDALLAACASCSGLSVIEKGKQFLLSVADANGTQQEQVIEKTNDRPILRTILADVAQRADISPYGGEGTISVSSASVKIRFTNTAGNVRLESGSLIGQEKWTDAGTQVKGSGPKIS